MTSCLAKVITNEVFALFKAWKAAHKTILIPANTKLKLMIFNAGIPNQGIGNSKHCHIQEILQFIVNTKDSNRHS